MPPANDTIAQLTDLLASGADRPLTDAERDLIRAALTELAAAHDTIARQRALLASYDHDIQAIDAADRAALDRLRDLAAAPVPGSNYDFAHAEEARNALLRAVREASTGGAILNAVLRFVAIAGGIAP